MEYLDIIDEFGNPTGQTVERSVAHAQGIPHRTSHVWLLRRRGNRVEILLQKRCDQKSSFPGCYDISSAGHIPAGADFRESAIRELKEELGLDALEKDLLFCGDRQVIWDDVFFGQPYHDRQISRVFALWKDPKPEDFTFQPEEVSDVLWMELEEAISAVKDQKIPNCISLEELNMVKKKIAMNYEWTRPPKEFHISADKIEIITEPHTDLWQRTYYHFRNDNAPILQMKTEEKYFSFVVRTEFESKHRFDQCGVAVYLDSDNWLKASIEYENEKFQHLGSVVTNHGYSDWATTAIDASLKSMWYRLSRREDDFCIECSPDGVAFSQMRVCHLWEGKGEITFGIYACSPEDSSFKATFTEMAVTDCKWLAHDGQQPDEGE